MSEEILINGKKITELSDMFFEYCELKKENEDLKTYIQKMDKPEIKTSDSEIALKNIELQKENEKQKELIKQLEDFIKTDGEIDHINHEYTYKLQKENEELKKKNKELLVLSNNGGVLLVAESTKNKKYKQALEEIRNLAELEVMLDKNSKAFYPTNIQRILDEINEVLNE